MRHGRLNPSENRQRVRLRQAAASLLMASLLLSAVPATSLIASASPRTWSENQDADPVAQPGGAANRKEDTGHQRVDGVSSVRPRGREAPVDLRQVAPGDEAAPAAVGADPGDGPPPAEQNKKSSSKDQDTSDGRNENIRMWPMPAGSYTFTQPFGCVPQIAQFYQPGAGCPADRPVVHTGLDLAAPEGTPFYAAASGWVTEAGYDREVGVANTRIIIQHEGRNDGYATEYLHWIASFVDVGEHVEAGQLIGEVGSVGYSTGPHLHFSLIELDTGEHVDPTRWLPKEPGTEGYRGITPRRAAMRLPAGTTAGVPEHTDPNPPDVPTREDVPESADKGQGRKNRDKSKKDKQRQERRDKGAAGHNREKDSRTVSGKDGVESADGSASAKSKRSDRDRERTRKRERNRDGASKADNASGKNGSGDSRKERRDGNTGDEASRRDGKRASRKDENAVQQTDTRNKGNNGNGKGKGTSGGNGSPNKKNRQQDDAQQVVEETPTPAEETPSSEPVQEADNGSGRDSKDRDNGGGNSGDGGGTTDAADSGGGSEPGNGDGGNASS